MNTLIDFDMLIPEFDNEFTISVQDTMTAADIADILIPLMKTAIISNVTRHSEDDPIEIVRNMTDDDPFGVLTAEDANRLIHEARRKGYTVSRSLTPEVFLQIYEELKPEKED